MPHLPHAIGGLGLTAPAFGGSKSGSTLPPNLFLEEETNSHAVGSFEFRRPLTRKDVLESKRDFCRSFRGGSVALLTPARHICLRRTNGQDHQGDVSEAATVEAVEDFREQVLAYSLASDSGSGGPPSWAAGLEEAPRTRGTRAPKEAAAAQTFEAPVAVEGAGIITLGGSSSSSSSRGSSRGSSRRRSGSNTHDIAIVNSDGAVQTRPGKINLVELGVDDGIDGAKNKGRTGSRDSRGAKASNKDKNKDKRATLDEDDDDKTENDEENDEENDDDECGFGDLVGRQKDGSETSSPGPAVLERLWPRLEEVVRSNALESLLSIAPGITFAETVGLIPRILQPRFLVLVGPTSLRVASVGFAGEPVIGDHPSEHRTPYVATLVTENMLEMPLDPDRQELVVNMRYRLRAAGPFETSIESSVSAEAPSLLGLLQGSLQDFIEPSLGQGSGLRLFLRCVELPEGEIQERGDVTFFCVHVFPADRRDPWKVFRRYQQFRELYCALAAPPGSIAATAFPRRHWAALAGEKLEFRRRCLEDWLNEVIREAQSTQPNWCEPISGFLEARLSNPAALASVADVAAKQALGE